MEPQTTENTLGFAENDNILPPALPEKPESTFWAIAKVVIVSMVIVLPIRAFVAQPFIVQGASMEPTYHEHEYLVVDELSYLFTDPKRGDVIVFRYPRTPSQFFIKRIIGLPGERVEIRGGDVYIRANKTAEAIRLDESYLPSDLKTSPDTVSDLDEEEYFVMGDNRFHSHDSRQWGVLDSKYIIGRSWMRLWPITRLGIVS